MNRYEIDYSKYVQPMETIRKKVIEAIANDRDGKIRTTLIELGWTPPDDIHSRNHPSRTRHS